MGLTVHYSFRHTETSAKTARAVVEKLRRRAVRLPFREVSPIYRHSPQDPRDGADTAPDWFRLVLDLSSHRVRDGLTVFAERAYAGWWYYYLYAMLVKVPVGTWILFLLAVYLTVRYRNSPASGRRQPPGDAVGGDSRDAAVGPGGLRPPLAVTWRDELVLLAPAVVVLVLVSSQTGFNHHIRYVLPAFPFGFIFISKVAGYARRARDGSPGMWFTILVAGALVWSVGSSLWVYPHSMSYFNELAGGPMNGHAHLVDSNIDWGQDLLYLKDWYDEHPEARPFHLAYFGGFDPHVAGFEYRLPPKAPEPGWHAVSVNLMRGLHFGVWNAQWRKEWAGEDRFTYFQHFEPTDRAGYSIYIYHITYDDAQRVRKKLGYPPLPPQ